MKLGMLCILAHLATLAFGCTEEWNPSQAYRGLEPKPTDLCRSVECITDEECDSNGCSNAPSIAEVENWVASSYKENLKMGTCTMPGYIIAFAILGGVIVLFGVGIYCYCCFRRRSIKYKLEKSPDNPGLEVSFSSD